MGADQTIDWKAAAESAIDWWRDAGVDVAVGDAPFDWLAAPEPVAPVAKVSRRDAEPTAAVPLPATMAAFLDWRCGASAPEAAWPGAAIAATGPLDAALMVLVDCPERDDADLLLGDSAAGRLLDRMLAAIGQSRDTVHVAAVCTRRPVAARVPRATEARLGEIARHHVALAAPQRLLVLGGAASRAILGIDLAEARGSLRQFNLNGGKTTAIVASFHPRFLLEKPACKAEAWKDLRMLMGNAA